MLDIRGDAAPRGHYGDAAEHYARFLHEDKKTARRFQDGNFHVFFGYDSGTNGAEDNAFPYLTFRGEEFEAGELPKEEKWAPGYRALLKK